MRMTARKSTCPSALATAQPAPFKLKVHSSGRSAANSKWDGVCRACLTAQHPQRLISLFLYWTPPWRPQRTSDDQIAKQLSKLTGVQIEECDGYPQHICHDCFETFKEAYRFYYFVRHKDNVMRSQQLLVEPMLETWTDPEHDQQRENNIRPTEIIQMQNNCEEEYVELEPKQEPDDDSDLPLDCMLCQKSFLDITALKEHVISTHSYGSVIPNHAGQNWSTCKDCRSKLAPHSNGGRQESRDRCDSCSRKHIDMTRKTKTVQQLRREAELEPPAKQRKGKELYECHLCKETFEEKIYLNIHTEACHNVAADRSRTNEKQPAVEPAGTKLQVQLLKTTDQVDSQNLLALLGYAEESVQPSEHLPQAITSDNVREHFESRQIIYDIGLRQFVDAADADQANGKVAYLHLPHSKEESKIVADNEKRREGEGGNDKDDNTIVVISEIKKELECQDYEKSIVPDQQQGEDIEMAAVNDTPNETMELSQASDNAGMSGSLPSVESFLEKENEESINHNGVQSIESFLSSEKDAEENIREDSPQCADDNTTNQNKSQDTVRNDIGQPAANKGDDLEKKSTSKHDLNILPNLNDVSVRTMDKEAIDNIFSDSENEEDDRPPYLEIIFDDDDDKDEDKDNPRSPSVHLANLVNAGEAQKESTTKDIGIEGPKVSSNVAGESNNGDQVA